MSDLLTDISRARFDALAGYCRHPNTMLFSTEVRWLQAHDETILVTVIRDHDDQDFGAIILAKDLKERYRFFNMTAFFDTPEEALEVMPELIVATLEELRVDPAQGDEKGKPIDFFTPVVAAEQLNPDFKMLATQEQYSPALELIKPMMRWYEDADGNFIEQFQTTGFDTRFWELYIFSMLVEARFALDKAAAIPDFCATGAFGEICVEATSVNPSRGADGKLVPPPTINTPEQLQEFLRQYMPIRFAGPLTNKLSKKYWEQPNVKGRPFILAIQDFHAPGSMTYTRTALPIYLYGMNWDHHHSESGELIITPHEVKTHKWGAKVIESGFFNLPGAENISAVITNASATISKFNRMGALAGFGSKRVMMIRKGTAANPNSNSSTPLVFTRDVNAPEYMETWIEGLDVYHNPNATIALAPELLPGAAHHRLRKDGNLDTTAPGWHPLGSFTHIFLKD